MSMLVELFGDRILEASLNEIKAKIKGLSFGLKERRAYLLKEYAGYRGIKLTEGDFHDIGLGGTV